MTQQQPRSFKKRPYNIMESESAMDSTDRKIMGEQQERASLPYKRAKAAASSGSLVNEEAIQHRLDDFQTAFDKGIEKMANKVNSFELKID